MMTLASVIASCCHLSSGSAECGFQEDCSTYVDPARFTHSALVLFFMLPVISNDGDSQVAIGTVRWPEDWTMAVVQTLVLDCQRLEHFSETHFLFNLLLISSIVLGIHVTKSSQPPRYGQFCYLILPTNSVQFLRHVSCQERKGESEQSKCCLMPHPWVIGQSRLGEPGYLTPSSLKAWWQIFFKNDFDWLSGGYI